MRLSNGQTVVSPSSTIEFWFSLTSPYSYLSAIQISKLPSELRVRVRWRPIRIGPIYKTLGWRVNPFIDHSEKLDYVFRDAQREAENIRIRFRRPRIFPQNPVVATNVAMLAFREGFGPEFCLAIYDANYCQALNIENEAIVCQVLEAICGSARALRLVKESWSTAVATSVCHEQDVALNKGLFGVPTFFVGSEQFWGNDRLERALQFAGRSPGA